MKKEEEMRALLLDTFNNRYTCKGYDPQKKVSDEDFKVIMEVARLSPSSMGLEPWEICAAQTTGDRGKRIKPFAWELKVSLDGASHFVLILARKPIDLEPDSPYVEYMMNDIQHFTDDLRTARKNKLKSFQRMIYKSPAMSGLFFDWACKQDLYSPGKHADSSSDAGD